ncbi:hypothetical protein GUITHDRAFT_139081 [Guillardia theta CCMP2712]|uniref:Uncharacterized protein n=1 Tax=Guillardia theta (strain CCMP2712) TaxID=905079 RepID=L1J9E0_GUITC|nr:hypothetical protein GUITHDRAFT_139081 [Guillardia theta CCMP2712]EKX45146.1 hypothetical protein GUITHDRAFT_139081 [Guillardia theta CCMP2712]|eukprot:XP_005832126.1 hypothetical protein GUITHDRAFT_139081 [Guillardia theta CCMP2712]
MWVCTWLERATRMMVDLQVTLSLLTESVAGAPAINRMRPAAEFNLLPPNNLGSNRFIAERIFARYVRAVFWYSQAFIFFLPALSVFVHPHGALARGMWRNVYIGSSQVMIACSWTIAYYSGKRVPKARTGFAVGWKLVCHGTLFVLALYFLPSRQSFFAYLVASGLYSFLVLVFPSPDLSQRLWLMFSSVCFNLFSLALLRYISSVAVDQAGSGSQVDGFAGVRGIADKRQPVLPKSIRMKQEISSSLSRSLTIATYGAFCSLFFLWVFARVVVLSVLTFQQVSLSSGGSDFLFNSPVSALAWTDVRICEQGGAGGLDDGSSPSSEAASLLSFSGGRLMKQLALVLGLKLEREGDGDGLSGGEKLLWTLSSAPAVMSVCVALLLCELLLDAAVECWVTSDFTLQDNSVKDALERMQPLLGTILRMNASASSASKDNLLAKFHFVRAAAFKELQSLSEHEVGRLMPLFSSSSSGMLEGLVGKHLETLRSFCDTLRVQLAKAEGIRAEVNLSRQLVVSRAEVTWQVEKSAMADKLGIPGQGLLGQALGIDSWMMGAGMSTRLQLLQRELRACCLYVNCLRG